MSTSINHVSPFPPITSLQPQHYHEITHSFVPQQPAIPSILNNFRTLSVATGVVPPRSFAPLRAPCLLYASSYPSLFHQLAASLLLPKRSRPLESSECGLFRKTPGWGVALPWLAPRWAHAAVAPASCWRVRGPQFFSSAPLLKSRKAAFVADPVKKTVYLSLGSNVADRAKNLRDAIAALSSAGVRVVRVSLTYETEPVDYLDQPWFLNCAVEAETGLAALDL